MDDALTGRRVLIVGASAGIGAALGQAAIEAGASVTISARRQDKLNFLIADWGAGNAIAADATDPEAVRAMVAEAAEQMGGLDLVVYVAGFGFLQPLAETDPDGWVDVFRVNVVGANLVAGAALSHLGPDGAVAFISSRTVEDNNAFFAPSSATRAALCNAEATTVSRLISASDLGIGARAF